MTAGTIVDPRFTEVAAKAVELMEAATGGALCIHLDGEPVLDIWAGRRDPVSGEPWEADTMAMAWSTTKGVASTAVHMLADRGRLDYDDRIATHWPEFAQNGKAETTIRHVLSMEAGLYDIRHLIDDARQMLDREAMVAAIERARPVHPPGAASGYHALTYGWIVGELVRRISGAGLGDFVQREIAEPLALDGCYIGLPASELGRVAARPALPAEPAKLRRAAKAVDPVGRLLGVSPARMAAAFAPVDGHTVMSSPEFLAVEVASANGVFTARSLSRLYAALGSDDGIDGVTLWSRERKWIAATRQNRKRDLVIPLPVGWLLGYHRPFPKRQVSAEAFGFYGAYGSGAFADPARKVAVGFVVQEASGMPLVRLLPDIMAAVGGGTRRRRRRLRIAKGAAAE